MREGNRSCRSPLEIRGSRVCKVPTDFSGSVFFPFHQVVSSSCFSVLFPFFFVTFHLMSTTSFFSSPRPLAVVKSRKCQQGKNYHISLNFCPFFFRFGWFFFSLCSVPFAFFYSSFSGFINKYNGFYLIILNHFIFLFYLFRLYRFSTVRCCTNFPFSHFTTSLFCSFLFIITLEQLFFRLL